MSKFVLCAANCVKIASCHCAFGTVLTLTVTFGRVFVYSLPSSSSACAGRPLEPQERQRHRLVATACSWRRRGLRGSASTAVIAPPQAASVSAAAAATIAADDLKSPLHSLLLQEGWACSDSRRHCEPCTRLARNLRRSCIACQLPLQFLALPITVALLSGHGHRHRATAASPCSIPPTGPSSSRSSPAGPDDGIAAVDAAAAAAADWAARAPRERAEILRRAFDLMIARNDEIARLIVREMGKPLRRGARRGRLRGRVPALVLGGGGARERRLRDRPERREPDAGRARADRDRAADHALELPGRDGHAQARPGARRGLHGRAQAGRGDAADRARDRAAAGGGRRAGGRRQRRLHRRAGAARGGGPRATRACASCRSRARPRSAAGCSSCARRSVVSASMELGGNSPFLVLDDADLDVAIAGAMAAKMRNGGEACTAANRFLVHESVAEDVHRPADRGDGRRARRGAASPTAPSSGR